MSAAANPVPKVYLQASWQGPSQALSGSWTRVNLALQQAPGIVLSVPQRTTSERVPLKFKIAGKDQETGGLHVTLAKLQTMQLHPDFTKADRSVDHPAFPFDCPALVADHRYRLVFACDEAMHLTVTLEEIRSKPDEQKVDVPARKVYTQYDVDLTEMAVVLGGVITPFFKHCSSFKSEMIFLPGEGASSMYEAISGVIASFPKDKVSSLMSSFPREAIEALMTMYKDVAGYTEFLAKNKQSIAPILQAIGADGLKKIFLHYMSLMIKQQSPALQASIERTAAAFAADVLASVK